MPDLQISELLRKGERPLLSFEFFPPKDDQGVDALQKAAEKLLFARPDFVTVTYGAGGSTRARTQQVCQILQKMGFDPVMPHLTCVGSSRAELEQIIDGHHAAGYRNIMALRGDPPQGEAQFRPAPDGLSYASDLVAMIRSRQPDICCGVAGYPEKHPEAATMESDVAHLTRKANAGASFITTQLFFDNRFYFDFVSKCRAAGIHLPVIPGLLPAISLKQARRMAERCKTEFPAALAQQMEQAGGDTEAAERVAVNWTANQIKELLAKGVPGIHLYVLNRARAPLAQLLAECFRR